MLHMATRLGFTEVVASVLADNNGMLHLFKTTDLQWDTTVHDGVAYMRPAADCAGEGDSRAQESPRRKVDAGAEDAPAPGKETPRQEESRQRRLRRKAAAKRPHPQGRGQKVPEKHLPKRRQGSRHRASLPAARVPLPPTSERSTPDDLVSLTGPGC